jgi:hypothetical protein
MKVPSQRVTPDSCKSIQLKVFLKFFITDTLRVVLECWEIIFGGVDDRVYGLEDGAFLGELGWPKKLLEKVYTGFILVDMCLIGEFDQKIKRGMDFVYGMIRKPFVDQFPLRKMKDL